MANNLTSMIFCSARIWELDLVATMAVRLTPMSLYSNVVMLKEIMVALIASELPGIQRL